MSAGDEGVVTCTLPLQDPPIATGATADCTVSVLDQRDWGGCVDIQMASAAAVLPPVPPTPVVSSVGAYQITKNTVIDTSAASFTCCALEAELTVPDYIEGAVSFDATLSGKANGCTAALRPLRFLALTLSPMLSCPTSSLTISHRKPAPECARRPCPMVITPPQVPPNRFRCRTYRVRQRHGHREDRCLVPRRRRRQVRGRGAARHAQPAF